MAMRKWVAVGALLLVGCGESDEETLKRMEDELGWASLIANQSCERVEEVRLALQRTASLSASERARLQADTTLWRRLGYRDVSHADVMRAEQSCAKEMNKRDSIDRSIRLFLR